MPERRALSGGGDVVDGFLEQEWEVLSSMRVTAMEFSVEHVRLHAMDVSSRRRVAEAGAGPRDARCLFMVTFVDR